MNPSARTREATEKQLTLALLSASCWYSMPWKGGGFRG